MIADNRQTDYAVITGDIVKSAKLDPISLKIVLQKIQYGQKRFNSVYADSMIGKIDIFSGDSWQALMKHVYRSFRAVLYFRATVKAVKDFNADTRIALAWGPIDQETVNPESISESTGEAFTISGRVLAEMNRSQFLAMEISETLSSVKYGALKALPPAMLLLDEISSRWTAKQAETIALALLDTNQKQIAAELSIVQSTVNKSLNAAGWKRIKEYLDIIEYRLSRR